MSSLWKYTSITQILLFIFWESSTSGSRNQIGPNIVPRKNLGGRQVCLAFRIPLPNRPEGIWNGIENGDCLSSETVKCWHSHYGTTTGKHSIFVPSQLSARMTQHDSMTAFILPFLLINDLMVKYTFTVNAGSPGTLEYHTLSHADGYFQCSLTLLHSAMFSILNSVEENI